MSDRKARHQNWRRGITIRKRERLARELADLNEAIDAAEHWRDRQRLVVRRSKMRRERISD